MGGVEVLSPAAGTAGVGERDQSFVSDSTAIVPQSNMAALESLSVEAREVAMTGMLEQAHQWLAHAVASSVPVEDIANFRAYIATAAETAKRLRLSKEIRQDAEVMVRRSERALGQAVRDGQENGEIRKPSERSGAHVPGVRGTVSLDSVPELSDTTPSPSVFLGRSGEVTAQVYAMTDGVTDAEFEEALSTATEEGNVSRANVVRKLKDRNREDVADRDEEDRFWNEVRALAYLPIGEVFDRVNNGRVNNERWQTQDGFRHAASKRGITFPDTRRVQRARADQEETFTRSLMSIQVGVTNLLELIDLRNIDPDLITEALERLTTTRDDLNRVIRNLKKETNK